MMDTEQRARELRILADQCRGREDAAYRFEKGASALLATFERETLLWCRDEAFCDYQCISNRIAALSAEKGNTDGR